jgi:putative DNA primase/helicase
MTATTNDQEWLTKAEMNSRELEAWINNGFRQPTDETPTETTEEGAPATAGHPPTEWPSPRKPMAVARQFLEQSDRQLRFWRGRWWTWHTTHWTICALDDLKAELLAVLEHAYYIGSKSARLSFDPTDSKVTNVIKVMQGMVARRSEAEAPGWSDGRDGLFVSLHNGILDLATKKLLPHSSDYFNLFTVDCDYDPGAQCPVWLRTMDAQFDKLEQDLLQEWFGYVVSGKTDQQKIMVVTGPRRSGKGTSVRCLKRLLGGNIASPSTSDLMSPFGRQTLIGKPLAVVNDMRVEGNTAKAVETLLNISGEDDVQIDVKHATQWTGKLGTRIMLVSNMVPNLRDNSRALSSRFLTLTTKQSFLNHEDKALDGKIAGELSGVVNWALEGLARLEATGRFTRHENADAEMNEQERLSSPVSAFLEDECILGPDQIILSSVMYKYWTNWCTRNGYQPGSSSKFGTDLLGSGYRIRKGRENSGQRRWHYQGVGIQIPATAR